jgi:hypothetical protein
VKLTNGTPIPAEAVVSSASGDVGLGYLVAKATFTFDARGVLALDTQEPLPLLTEDEQTPVGLLPSDVVPRRGTKFEVILVGYAYPPAGQHEATSVSVALSVGRERRELKIFGERYWTKDRNGNATISSPRPFDRMPLVYERAYGGWSSAQFDKETIIDVFDPINRIGKGFDAEAVANGIASQLKAPKGYPVLTGYRRALPNLENPRALIRQWQDAPEPVGWAAAPRDTLIAMLRMIRKESARTTELRRKGELTEEAYAKAVAGEPEDPDTALYRAHSDWVIDVPPSDAIVRLEGLVRDAPVVEFRLPRLRLLADYIVYGREGTRPLRPHALIMMPEEHKLALVYRAAFTFERGPANERAFRLRMATGWDS